MPQRGSVRVWLATKCGGLGRKPPKCVPGPCPSGYFLAVWPHFFVVGVPIFGVANVLTHQHNAPGPKSGLDNGTNRLTHHQGSGPELEPAPQLQRIRIRVLLVACCSSCCCCSLLALREEGCCNFPVVFFVAMFGGNFYL